MYSRYLLKTNHFGWISDILLPFSSRTHRVRTAKMEAVYQKFISKFFVEKITRVHLIYNNLQKIIF